MNTPFLKPKLLNSVVFFSIVVLSFVFYGNSLYNQYSLDDNYVIVNQKQVAKGIAGIPRIFKSHYVNNPEEVHSYRPITLTSFAIEQEFFGANPFVSHLINILLYSICCFLVFRLVLYLGNKEQFYLTALLASLIFLSLPLHTEVVNNVKCRDELLSFSFGLGALIQFLKFAKTQLKLSFLMGILLLALSLLAKLSSLPLLFLIPFCVALFFKPKKRTLATLGFVMVLVVFSIKKTKKLILKTENKVRDKLFLENPLYDDNESFFDRIPIALKTIGNYIEGLIFPNNLISYYGYNQIEIVDWSNRGAWLLLLLFIGAAVFVFKYWRKYQLMSFGLVWFFASISMFSNLIKPVPGIYAERLAFFPSLGFSLLIAALLYRAIKINYLKNKKLTQVITFSLLFAFVSVNFTKVYNRNPAWFNKLTLLRNDVKLAPNSAKLNALLANTLFEKIKTHPSDATKIHLVNEAIYHYKASVTIYPAYATSWNNMGTIIFNEFQDYQQALAYYKNAIKYRANYKVALFGAAYANEVLGNQAEALNYYYRVMELDPNFRNTKSRIFNLIKQQ